ncbi:expressed protein [Echinococcus multilocularis]|uniref:Expressed protein n=1 Tax=Echinococcus multilocularis TaxID=6211 RepID=A0A068YBD3_ECHMU|nr:expressed protein [Echinococcus multilocularis]
MHTHTTIIALSVDNPRLSRSFGVHDTWYCAGPSSLLLHTCTHVGHLVCICFHPPLFPLLLILCVCRRVHVRAYSRDPADCVKCFFLAP